MRRDEGINSNHCSTLTFFLVLHFTLARSPAVSLGANTNRKNGNKFVIHKWCLNAFLLLLFAFVSRQPATVGFPLTGAYIRWMVKQVSSRSTRGPGNNLYSNKESPLEVHSENDECHSAGTFVIILKKFALVSGLQTVSNDIFCERFCCGWHCLAIVVCNNFKAFRLIEVYGLGDLLV